MQKEITPDSECNDFSSLMIPYIQNYVCVVLPTKYHPNSVLLSGSSLSAPFTNASITWSKCQKQTTREAKHCRYMLILSTHPLLTHHDRFMFLRQVASPKAVKDLRLTEIQAIEWTPTVSMTSLPFCVCSPHQNHSNISGICWMRPQLVDFNGFLLCFPRDLCGRPAWATLRMEVTSESIRINSK